MAKKKERCSPNSPKKPKRQKQMNPRFRSTLVAFDALMEIIEIRDEHINLLRKTPFWHLFEAFIERRVNFVKKFDESSIRMIGQYNSLDGTFTIGPERLRIQPSEIQLIFGIVNGTRVIDTYYAAKESSPKINSPFVQRRFPGEESMHTPIIRTELLKAVAGHTREDVIDTVILLCLYICGTLLYANRGDRVRWGFVNYIEDIDNMCQYDWCSSIVGELKTSIEKKRRDPYTVTGCILALQYWLCEHTTLVESEIKPSMKDYKKKMIPRFLKWDPVKLHRIILNTGLATLSANQVIAAELEMTIKEMEVYCPILDRLGGVQKCSNKHELAKGIRHSNKSDSIETERTDSDDCGAKIQKGKRIVGSNDVRVEQCLEVDTSLFETDGVPQSVESPACGAEQPTNKEPLGEGTSGAKSFIDLDVESLWQKALFYSPTQKSPATVWKGKGTAEDSHTLPQRLDFNIESPSPIVDETTDQSRGTLMDAANDPSEQMRGLVRDNAFQAFQINKLERQLKNQLETSEAILESDNMNMAAEIIALNEEIDKYRKDNAEILEGLQDHLKLKDDEIMKLQIEIKRQKALNNQLRLEVMSYRTRDLTQKDPTTPRHTPPRKRDGEKPYAVEKAKKPRAIENVKNAPPSVERRHTRSMDVKVTSVVPSNASTMGKAPPEVQEYKKTRKNLPKKKVGTTSLVRRVKNKVRKPPLRRKSFLYPGDEAEEPDQLLVHSEEPAVINLDQVNLKTLKDAEQIMSLLVRSPVYTLLSEDDKAKMRLIMDRAYTLTRVYTTESGNEYVTMADLYSIILGHEIPNNVISCHVEKLTIDQSAGKFESEIDDDDLGSSFVFHSLCLHWVRTNDAEHLGEFVDPKFGKPTAGFRYLIYPLLSDSTSSSGKHWTLAVFDSHEPLWRFYNSLRPTNPLQLDRYQGDLYMMKQYVEDWQRKARGDGRLDVSTQDIETPVENVRDSPQQAPGTLDCGVIICQIMSQIFAHLPVTSECDATHGRADLVHEFLNTPVRSWTLQEHIDREKAFAIQTGADEDQVDNQAMNGCTSNVKT